jgi:hypothetical protein
MKSDVYRVERLYRRQALRVSLQEVRALVRHSYMRALRPLLAVPCLHNQDADMPTVCKL